MHQQQNPLGVGRFEFCEFAAPEPKMLHQLFLSMGFTAVARHKTMAATLYRQNQINFIVNEQVDCFASEFAQAHGPCCVGFGLRLENAETAYETLMIKGAEPISDQANSICLQMPAIKGIGGSVLYLSSSREQLDAEFEPLLGVDQNPRGFGLTFIDHLTHNVYDGNMDQWADYYTRFFNFFEVKYFDIKGQQTGLRSRAMTAPHGEISIPINESSDPKSQINEYLNEYRGEGVQHIALFTDDIYESVELMRQQNVSFLDTPDTYYDVVDIRVPKHDEDVVRMQANKILIDADQQHTDQQLLQIFTHTNIGPIFFEVIQRKGNNGFGEGNFQALFEAIERDQEKRGVL